MADYILKVEANEEHLAEVIRLALAGEDLGTGTPDYRLAAHAFLNYMEQVTKTGENPNIIAASGHLFFALNGYRPSEGADVTALVLGMSEPTRRLIQIAGEEAWAYMREVAARAEKVRVQ